MRILIGLLTMLALGACSDEALMRKFSSPKTQATAIAYLDQLRARDFAALERDADPSIAGGASRRQSSPAGGALRYIMLSAAIVAVLLTLYALVLGIRTRFKGRKWPWIVFVLVGLGKISVNWTTGDWSIAPIGVQLFSAAATVEIYGP
jgi:hypothetical protein